MDGPISRLRGNQAPTSSSIKAMANRPLRNKVNGAIVVTEKSTMGRQSIARAANLAVRWLSQTKGLTYLGQVTC
jgi:hypothetical protein